MAGSLGVDVEVFIAWCLEASIVVELSHTTAIGPVAGISTPIVSLG